MRRAAEGAQLLSRLRLKLGFREGSAAAAAATAGVSSCQPLADTSQSAAA
jgi:hypothetical protein